MEISEFGHLIAAVLIMTATAGLYYAIKEEWTMFIFVFLFMIIILSVNVIAKKFMAYMVDSDVRFEIWQWERFGYRPWMHLPKPIPMGIIAPLFLSVVSLGSLKFLAPLTYEAKALTHRAARRFGFYSWQGLTDYHHGIIGAGGILAVLILAFVAYILPDSGLHLQLLAQFSAYFAFSNMLPLSNLDGTQIFFGSKILYFTLGIITLVFAVYSMLIGFGAI